MYRFETTADRLKKLMQAAGNGKTANLSKELHLSHPDHLIDLIKQNPTTAQNIRYISHTLMKCVDGARAMPKGNPLKYIKREFNTPALKKLLDNNTLDIVKAVMPPKKIMTLPVSDITTLKPRLGNSETPVIPLYHMADVRPLYIHFRAKP